MLLERAAKSLTSEAKLSLVRALPPEAVMQHLRGAAPDEWPIGAMLEQLPMPWPRDFAADWLRRLQRAAAREPDAHTYLLAMTMDITARALPLALYDDAVRDWTFPETNWGGEWDRRVEKLTRIIRLRKMIAEESAS